MRKLEVLKEKYEDLCKDRTVKGEAIEGVEMYGPHDLNGPVSVFIVLEGGENIRVCSSKPRRGDLSCMYPPMKKDFEGLFDERDVR